jgi:hypothetical protein
MEPGGVEQAVTGGPFQGPLELIPGGIVSHGG